MLGSINKRFRIVASLIMLALALAVLPAVGNAFAGAPVKPAAGAPSQGNTQQATRPQMIGSAGKVALGKPANPDVVLYDQYINAGTNAINSQNFEAANSAFDDQAADDFVVPAGQSWSVEGVDVDGAYFNGAGPSTAVNVYFYTNSGSLPSVQVAAELSLPYAPGPGSGDFVITLSPAVVLPEGTYWVSVQARMDFTPGGQWGWTGRTVTSNSPSAWRNPGGGFAAGCNNWGPRATVCIPTSSTEPDHVFRLNGTVLGPQPTFTPAATYTPIPTSTTAPTNTATATVPTATPTNTPNCAQGWSQMTPVPAPLLDEAVTSVGGQVYSFAGVVNGAISALSYKYDPGTNAWSSIAPLPSAREKPSAVTDGTFAYIFGGANTAGANTNTLYKYDPLGNSYTVLASNPFTTTWAQAGAYLPRNGGEIYWIAGCGANCASFSNTVYAYSITGNSWSQVANYPESDGFLMAVGDGTYVYAAGGINTVESLKTYRYDPVANSWSDAAIADLPATRWGAASDFFSGKWLLAGGYSNNVIVASSISWDPVGNTWGPPNDNMVQARARLSGATAAGAFYAIGGREPGGAFGGTTDNQRFIPVQCNATNTPTFTATNTPTATATVCGVAAGWAFKAPFNAVGIVRAVGVYFPGNGKFYAMGGRTSDAAGSDLQNPREYDPVLDAWTTKAATYPTNFMNNMAGGVLNIGGRDYIVTVGGSFAGGATATGDTRQYDPVADTITTISTDPWPDGASVTLPTLPGGFAVVSNKLYILGGFTLPSPRTVTNKIWEFDPARPAGSRWLLKGAVLPVAAGYVPATTISGLIYGAGGVTTDGTNLFDSNSSFTYNPTTDIVGPIATIPRATGETRAVTVDGEMWVLGGGRTAPNPSNQVNIYNPGTNSWRLGTPFTTARRNFPADSNGLTGSAARVYLSGGYAPSTAINTTEVYAPGALCTPTPTPTTSGVINGHLTWQGVLAANRPLVTGTLTLCVSAGVTQTYSFNTDTNGNFTITTGLPDGTYNWKVKGGRHISTSSPTDGTALVISGGAATKEFGLQKGGNTNTDNIINSTDFNALKNQFGQSGVRSADFDYNLVVNASDFNIQKANFGQAGHELTCP